MDVLERMRETIVRLFGPGATLDGSMGSGVGPGHVEIRIDGLVAGVGRTLADAINEAQQTLNR